MAGCCAICLCEFTRRRCYLGVLSVDLCEHCHAEVIQAATRRPLSRPLWWAADFAQVADDLHAA